ncbi:hypothetical protein AUJ29_02470 [Candidatus Kuenenbacteria bacterium CG1_02_38_13]|uniref:Glycosyltransferase RgtA/B/C/D-like domain-containing protein n=1 Tax=Candidatus Kuenenbacteria bacterium CG1_02_38_13 TaxID=1805235 RepID=A0A1J4TYH1_9BACT|nr:MAG: hypothetical protein AUJ29_02470 [Candidatus Kuenenbacteria bacterium CG1_02_38_13]
MFKLNNRKLSFLLFLTLVALFVLQLHNVLIYPIRRGFDALPHLDYINYVKTHWSVPMADQGWEMFQPPLYYFASALFSLILNPQLLGLVVWLTLVLITYFFINRLYHKIDLSLAGVLIVGLLPVNIYLMPTISNELFSALITAVFLIVYYLNFHHEKISYKKTIIIGVILGLCLLTKTTALLLIPAIIIDLMFLNRIRFIIKLKSLLIILCIAYIISGWFYIRNYFAFGKFQLLNVDLPKFSSQQPISRRDFLFFTDLSGFTERKLYRSQYDQFLSGTYFSFFYDGHNVIVPVVAYSKIGVVIVLMSFPLIILAIVGILIKKRSDDSKIMLIYPFFLFMAYIWFVIKYPYFSSIKGSYLASLTLPLVYFIIKGVIIIKKKFNDLTLYNSIFTLYLILYVAFIIKHFWYQSWWK